MVIRLLQEYILGDMVVRYYMDDESKNTGLLILPESLRETRLDEKRISIDSMVQLKVAGDIYPTAYSQGTSMRNGQSTLMLQFRKQETGKDAECTKIRTMLTSAGGFEVEHLLSWYQGSLSLEIETSIINTGAQERTLEMLSSFSIGGITPYEPADAPGILKVHRLRSKWSAEGRHITDNIEDLQLEPSWAYGPPGSERFGQLGSMPVKGYFPYVAVEDTKNHVWWGAQLANLSSWQMELYRKDDALNVSGGIADREFGHWLKKLYPGERFNTPKAILSVCCGNSIDDISHRLAEAGRRYLKQVPESEQSLPLIFNEYCSTWGSPSHENIVTILDHIKGRGFSYFVIDCGWYKNGDQPWHRSMGDYDVSTELFPEGLDKTVAAIKAAGMKPGIWFEIETIGDLAKAYNQEQHLLKRDGVVVTTASRRFWDMTDPWVIDYLGSKVIGMLKAYGFEYIKIDYNDTIGIGCDGAESLGEGLRLNMEGTLRFIRKLKAEIPNIIIENCASGGHRLEPLMMSECSMASFSDAHEGPEIAVIAADLHRAILPAQSQIWAVIRQEDSLKRIAYSIANTFLGRMCLSGDVTHLSKEQWAVIDEGICFYQKIRDVIRDGFSYRYGRQVASIQNLDGWQGVVRVGQKHDALVVIHNFKNECEHVIEIDLPEGIDGQIEDIFAHKPVEAQLQRNVLTVKNLEEMQAIALYLN